MARVAVAGSFHDTLGSKLAHSADLIPVFGCTAAQAGVLGSQLLPAYGTAFSRRDVIALVLQAGREEQMPQGRSGPIDRDHVNAVFQIPGDKTQRFHRAQNPEDAAGWLAAELGVADYDRRPRNHQRKIGELLR